MFSSHSSNLQFWSSNLKSCSSTLFRYVNLKENFFFMDNNSESNLLNSVGSFE